MTKKLLNIFCLVMAVVLAVAFCACESGTPKVTVTFYESDGVTAIKQVEVKSGETIEQPELTKEGYDIQGFYATPALLVPFDFTQAITEDTSVFVAWKSNKVDERPWMLAGSLRGYPENSWGRIWPQDDYLLTKSADAFNTFTIEVNLYNGDEFKIAVIGEGYAWDDTASIDASHLADKSENAVLVGGGNVFDTGANIKVTQDGFYRLTLVTDAEELALCSLSYEYLHEADAPQEIQYDMKLWASFNDWAGQDMTRNGDDLIWYCEADVPAGGEFGVKNCATDAWYSSPDGNIVIAEEGHYMFFIELELVDGVPTLKGEIVAAAPNYYVVGTCGNGAWAGDANAENTNYMMVAQDDGTYALTVTFTEADTADWTNGQVAFKCVYGCAGRVANEFWFGAEDGNNIMVDVGTYTIVLDPATGVVTVNEAE